MKVLIKNNLKVKNTILTILGILLLILMTVGTTYAVFTYSKQGSTENTVTTGILKFLYTENTGVGAGISMTNAFPISDEVGKAYSTDGLVFDFKIEGTNTGIEEIPYEVTLRKKSDSTLSEDAVKVYLTDIDGETETQILSPTLYSNLTQTTLDVDDNIEKTLYYGEVAGNTENYEKNFRLRMWLKEGLDFTSGEYNNKTFTTTVNVYADTNVVIERSTYKEAILNGTDPVLTNELTPVKISSDGTVTKANTTNQWYSYENKEWANAVITRNSYEVLNTRGNVNGATLNDGYVSFDGVDDYIDLGLENYDFSSDMSASVQIMFNSAADKSEEFFGNTEAGGFGLYLDNDKIKLLLYIDGNSGYTTLASTSTIELHKLYTITCTYDGETIKLYINGVLETEYTISGNIKISEVPIYLGANPQLGNTGMEFSDSNIKKAVIFDRALSEDEIKQNFVNDIKIYNDNELLSYVNFTNESYSNDEIIPEDNIESYFVWIPRYKYKLFDEGNYTEKTQMESKEQTIEIIYENKNTTPSNGTTVGDYLTHPAFTSFDSNGFWVGKFETGYDGATTTSGAQVDTVSTDKIIIKPNVYSWRSMTVGNMFKNSYDYLRDLDSHMMKNTEWGAVAYLQHSSYGSATSVRINNNSSFITGYSAIVEPTVGLNGGTSIEGNRVESTTIGVDGTYTVNYLNPNSVTSSTTGNYTGIYDMSGGTWDYVMGYTTEATTVGGSSGITDLYTDFFSDTTYTKYWDKYTSTDYTNYNNRILGDATGEMGPFGKETDPDGAIRSKSSWYRDLADFADVDGPWFYRGGCLNSGTYAGDFAFTHKDGGGYGHIGFRIVLTP